MPSAPRRAVLATSAAAVLVLLSACHGDPGNSAGSPPAVERKVVAVSVSPDRPAVPLGLHQQLAATATYDDGECVDATGVASWSSSDPLVVSVDDQLAKGLLTPVATGTATVTVLVEGVVGSATVQVWPAVPASIQVSVGPMVPSPEYDGRILAVGDQRPLIALATLTDGTLADATDAATWTSSDPAVAGMGERAGDRGWVSGVAPGTATVTASLGTLEGSFDVEVDPCFLLSSWIPNTLAPSLDGVGIDDSGRAWGVLSYQFSGGIFGTPAVIATFGYDPSSGWSAPALVDVGTIDDKPSTLLRLSVNRSGAGLLAWGGQRGVYATVLGADGWQTARTLASGPSSPLGWYAQGLFVALDGAGSGLVVWADANGEVIYFSRYDQATGAFSPAQPVPGVASSWAISPLQLAMNPAGAAVLVWGNVRYVFASRFTPGTDPSDGWQAPETLDDGSPAQVPSAAMDGSGRIVVTWVDSTLGGSPICTVCARRFDPAIGWLPQDTVLAPDASGPGGALVAMNDAGAAIVAWSDAHNAIRVSRADPGGPWEDPETLDSGTTSASTPDVLPPHLTGDGRILVVWTREAFNPPRVARRRFTPGVGWDPTEALSEIQHFGSLNRGGIHLAFDTAGNSGVALWKEDYDVRDLSTWLRSTNSDIFGMSGLTY